MQKQAQLLDFSDLICLPLYLFDKYPEVKEYWANRFDYIMIDEFQDVSGAQYDFAMALASKRHNLFVVGDPDQMIYSWRGAKMEYFMDFPKPYQGKTIYMNTNYRSEFMLVEAANRLISHNTNRIEKISIAKRVDRWSPFEEIHEKTPDDVAESVAWQLKQWEMILLDENEIIYDFLKSRLYIGLTSLQLRLNELLGNIIFRTQFLAGLLSISAEKSKRFSRC